MSETLNSCRILHFSRGRGYGHAIPDLAWSRHVRTLRPDWSIAIATYADGLKVFREQGIEIHDLGLGPGDPILSSLFACKQLIAELQPTIVIAHEEFGALPAAFEQGIPSILLSDWIPPAAHPAIDTLAYASGIVLMGDEGLFPFPRTISCRPRFVGAMVRSLPYDLQGKAQYRLELGWPQDSTVVLGTLEYPGSFPLGRLLLGAFDALPQDRKRLILVGESQDRELRTRILSRSDVVHAPFAADLHRLAIASDAVITKNTRITLRELSSLGVRSLSIADGRNPVDDFLVPRIRANTMLSAGALDPAVLARIILGQLERPTETPSVPRYTTENEVARAIVEEVEHLLAAPLAVPA